MRCSAHLGLSKGIDEREPGADVQRVRVGRDSVDGVCESGKKIAVFFF
mgnify:CR=1 FL=1